MDQLKLIRPKVKASKTDNSNSCHLNGSVTSLKGNDDCKRQEKSLAYSQLNSTNHSLNPRSEGFFDHCSTETAERPTKEYTSGTLGFIQQQESIQSKPLPFVCGICKKSLIRKHTFYKHLREKHSFQLTSESFHIVRKQLLQNGHYNEDIFFSQHQGLIKQIQTAHVENFPIPEQLKNRLNKSYIKQAKQQYESFHVVFQRSQLNFYYISNQNSSTCKRCQLNSSLMLSFKKLTLRFISQFQRYFQVFIKNISLSELFLLFLFNFSFNFPKYQASFLNHEMMQFFSSVLIDFEQWINKNHSSVFKIHNIFYYHIDNNDCSKYCERERTWKIDLLLREYLKDIKRRITSLSELKLANFIILCFHEYVILENLEM